MNFGAAISEHPLTTQAAGEVVGEVLEQVGEAPDLAVLFVSAAHLGLMAEIAETVRTALRPRALIGVTASSIVGGGREVEDRPAISLWAGNVGPVEPVRLETQRLNGGWALTGLPAETDAVSPRVLLLLADPFSIPTDGMLDRLRAKAPTLQVVGGMASTGRAPGGNRLVLDDAVFDNGAVGVLLDSGVVSGTVVSQGCRPVGQAYVVTRATDNVIHDLAGVPALDRLRDIVAGLPPGDRALVQEGLHVGRVIDEQKDSFGRGDFLISNVMGADPEAGDITIGATAEVGSTVQFQVRDADSADEDLRHLLAGQQGRAALVFTCNGRGRNLFDAPDHDARLVHDQVGQGAVAGMFCAGELGPVGGRNFVHGYTASVVLFNG
ncbi:MAG TPA: FIST N-terminal domain-containing protein [Acidimicrobiales bacterium]